MKMEECEKRRERVELVLGNKNNEIEELKKVIYESCVMNIIPVDSVYECENGLISTNRDIVMRLVRILGEKEKIRSLIGMAVQFYLWKEQRVWKWAVSQPKEIPIQFTPKRPLSGVEYVYSSLVSRVTFDDSYNSRTVFVSSEHFLLPPRIYQLNIIGSGSVGVGLTSKTTLPSLHHTSLCAKNETCMLHWNTIFVGSSAVVDGLGLWHWSGQPPVALRLELNPSEHTLHFVVNGRLVPHYVAEVPWDVCFAVCNFNGLSAAGEVRSLSSVLMPMPMPTAHSNSAAFKRWVWKS